MFNLLAQWPQRRAMKRYRRLLAEVSAMEPAVQALSADDLRVEIEGLKHAAAQDSGKCLVRAFAVTREVIRRELGLRPYDVQILGALAMLDNNIIEMGTGEGKTLTGVFVVVFKHLCGLQTHVSTANEFLAMRDARNMQPVYRFFGMTVGVTRLSRPLQEKRKVYQCAVVYGTHQAFALDYLSDNLALRPDHLLQQQGHAFALIDEADAVLLDEARAPVVMTADAPADSSYYEALGAIAADFVRGAADDEQADFWVDMTVKRVVLLDRGYEKAYRQLQEKGLLADVEEAALYKPENQFLVHALINAISARHLLFKDQHYVVQGGRTVLIDELTGRLMPDRSWSNGLQQALEQKEGLALRPESTTLGSITLQNYFKLYQGMAGMSGTAATEAIELRETYGLGVVPIPPNVPSLRVDQPDRVFRNMKAKFEAVVEDIKVRHEKGQPVLVGTPSLNQSEQLSALLTQAGLVHQVLNARHHEREGLIIAQAGAPGAITIATNMAGRGVDIVLGGNVHLDLWRARQSMGDEAWAALSDEEQQAITATLEAAQHERAEQVRAAGGLHVIGTERYDTRRMDLQLRGRCARQGDPGSTCFYLSLEDSLVANFAGEQIRAIMARLSVEAGDELEQLMVAKAIDSAQRQVEAQGATVRKQLLTMDEVLNDQRKAFYAQRRAMLLEEDIAQMLAPLRKDVIEAAVSSVIPEMQSPKDWDVSALLDMLEELGIPSEYTEAQWRGLADDEALLAHVQALAESRQNERAAQLDDPVKRNGALRLVALRVMDMHWTRHLAELEHLRQGAHLVGFAKKDPKQEYKREAFELFARLLDDIKLDIVKALMRWTYAPPASAEAAPVEPAPAEA